MTSSPGCPQPRPIARGAAAAMQSCPAARPRGNKQRSDKETHVGRHSGGRAGRHRRWPGLPGPGDRPADEPPEPARGRRPRRRPVRALAGPGGFRAAQGPADRPGLRRRPGRLGGPDHRSRGLHRPDPRPLGRAALRRRSRLAAGRRQHRLRTGASDRVAPQRDTLLPDGPGRRGQPARHAADQPRVGGPHPAVRRAGRRGAGGDRREGGEGPGRTGDHRRRGADAGRRHLAADRLGARCPDHRHHTRDLLRPAHHRAPRPADG